MSNLDYITNEFAKGYIYSRVHGRTGVFVPLDFIDMCNGNMYDAILFSQIMYWHEPNKETGKTRLRRVLDGNLWIAKNHGDWYEECRIKAPTVRKCLDRLKSSGLIHYELHGEKGLKTPYIRINWQVFEEKMKSNQDNSDNQTLDTTGQTPCYDISDPLIQQDEPNTETTQETTQETESIAPKVSDIKQKILNAFRDDKDSWYTNDLSKHLGFDTDVFDVFNFTSDTKIYRDVLFDLYNENILNWKDTKNGRYYWLATNGETKSTGIEWTTARSAIENKWNINGDRSGNIAHMLLGTAKDKRYAPYNLKVPATLAEIEQFPKWWSTNYENVELPRSPEIVQDRFLQMRKENEQASQINSNIRVVDRFESGVPIGYVSEYED